MSLNGVNPVGKCEFICTLHKNSILFKRLFSLMICVILLIPSLSFAAIPDFNEEEIDAKVKKLFKQYKTTGGAVVLAWDGEIIYEHYYGYAYKKEKERVDRDTYFRIASVSKLVTAVGAMQLVEKGLLNLDESISTYLGYKIQKKITLRTLLTHTSGLNSNSSYSRESNTLRDLLEKSRNYKKREPGTKYEYSNFGAGVIGSLIESVTDKNINDVITEAFFAPLGIDAAYHPSLLKNPEKISAIYSMSGTCKAARKTLLNKPWDEGVNPDRHYRISYGSVWIKPKDLCRIGIMLYNQGELDGVQILKESTTELMCSNQTGKGCITADTPYGLGVNIVKNLIKNKVFYGHQGLVDDALCNLYWDPETGFVFCLVTNGSSTKMDDHICILSRKLFSYFWQLITGE